MMSVFSCGTILFVSNAEKDFGGTLQMTDVPPHNRTSSLHSFRNIFTFSCKVLFHTADIFFSLDMEKAHSSQNTMERYNSCGIYSAARVLLPV